MEPLIWQRLQFSTTLRLSIQELNLQNLSLDQDQLNARLAPLVTSAGMKEQLPQLSVLEVSVKLVKVSLPNVLLDSTLTTELREWPLQKNASSALTPSFVMEVLSRDSVTLDTSVISEPSLLVIPLRFALSAITASRQPSSLPDVLREITME